LQQQYKETVEVLLTTLTIVHKIITYWWHNECVKSHKAVRQLKSSRTPDILASHSSKENIGDSSLKMRGCAL
jgi:hypothetical protein